ncbi:MAG: hypothetical protein L0K86_11635 [Actinomycetia bacterium]|nr:hypothetical protein [Actinomycetes bacterium]
MIAYFGCSPCRRWWRPCCPAYLGTAGCWWACAVVAWRTRNLPAGTATALGVFALLTLG